MADTYEVVNQRPVQVLTAEQRLVGGYEIVFLTKPSGISGTVRVEGQPPDPDKVAAALETASAALEAIQKL